MIESIAFALFLKKVQIVFISVAILFVSALSIYNLPWDNDEWENLLNSVRKIKLSTFKVQLLSTSAGSTADIECTIQKVHSGH